MVLQGHRVERETGRLSSSSILVGRDSELSTLTTTVALAPAVVFVEGEAGVGKSRLITEFRDAAPNPDRVLIGRCHPQRNPFLLEPVVEAMRAASPLLLGRRLPPVAGVLRGLLPELAELLPPAPAEGDEAGADGHRMFRALREVLSALGPAVLVLEDVQWADDTTGDLLHFLLTVPPPQLSLVLTYRTEDLRESAPFRSLAGRSFPGVASERVVLQPLDVAGVSGLIAAILEVEEISPEFAEFLHTRTGGVPFAVEEVLRLLQDRRDLVRQDGRWARRRLDRIEVPGAVRDAVLERLARLAPDTREVVIAAAVLGLPGTEDQLSEIAAVDAEQLPDALTEALQSGLLREDDRARSAFRHEFARQAAHEAIPTPQRRRYHLRAAQLLERSGENAAIVAHHYREAGRLDDWARHAERVAGEAAALERTDSCRILQDLQASPSLPLPVRIRLAAKLGHEPHLGLSENGAVDVVRRVLEDETDPRSRGELRMLLGHALIDAGEGAAGREEIVAAIAELGPDSPMAASAVITLADPRAPEGTLDDHMRWLDRAAEIAATTADPAVRLAVLATRAWVLMSVGDSRAWEAVGDMPDQWATVGERREAAAGLASVAVGASYTGHYGRARALLGDATALVEKFDCAHVLAGHDAIHAMLDWSTGAWAGLEERTKALLAQKEAGGPPRPSPERLVLNLLRLAIAGPEAARAGLEESLDLAVRAGVVPGQALAAGALGQCHLAAGAPGAALHAAQGALELIRGKGIWVWATEPAPPAVEALIALGRADEAAALVAEFRIGLEGRDAPAAQASLAFCEGLVAGAQPAVAATSHFETAHRLCLALPRPLAAALAQERWGVGLMGTDRVRGLELLLTALSALEELGAGRDAARLRQFLRTLGAEPPRPRGRRGYGVSLSPREQEIFDLVEAGHTHRVIAERLFLSERTIESHIRRARTKLAEAGAH